MQENKGQQELNEISRLYKKTKAYTAKLILFIFLLKQKQRMTKQEEPTIIYKRKEKKLTENSWMS